ncbi:hypothetical protein BOX15_Mlig004501g1, partial [Macrostomum lignano]
REPGSQTPGNRGSQTPGNRGSQTPGNRGSQTPGNRGSQTPGNRGSQTPGNRGSKPIIIDLQVPKQLTSAVHCRSSLCLPSLRSKLCQRILPHGSLSIRSAGSKKRILDDDESPRRL